MIQTKEQYVESIPFECWVLEKIYPLLQGDSNAELDLDLLAGSSSVKLNLSSTIVATDHPASDPKGIMLPLAFGAAWKVLDLTLEWSLYLNGQSPKNKYWRINEKKKAAMEPATTTNLFNGYGDCWSAVLKLYAVTEQHRHSLVHRTLLYDPSHHSLSGYSGDGVRLEDITKPQLYSFISIAQIVAKAVIAGGMSNREADHLKYELDQLQPHTGRPISGAKYASRPVKVRVTVQPDEGGTLTVDFPKIKQQTNQCVPDRLYDLCLSLPVTGRRLEGYLEETPNRRVELNVQSVPEYLRWV